MKIANSMQPIIIAPIISGVKNSIINQPQLAILALGAIRKVAAVLETENGDVIAIRQQMMVSHSYDHRIINGAMGGMFLLRLKQRIENWDESQTI